MIKTTETKISTGISGLDEILYGGLPRFCAYLVRGDAGSGKSIFGLHFLTEGVRRGEKVLYITLQEKENRIRAQADNFEIDTTGIDFLDLSPPPEFFIKSEPYQLFSPGQVDTQPITRSIIDTVTRLKPARIFIDPITQFRYFASDQFHFRKQTLSFLTFLAERNATVVLTSEINMDIPDDDLRVSVDGIIRLDHDADKRSITIEKMRGSDFIEGPNSLRIKEKGLLVFPRLIPAMIKREEFVYSLLSSGLPEFDKLLGGGVEKGTSTIISGPSGVGKTTFCMQFLKKAAENCERCVIFSFEEEIEVMVHRFESVSIPVKELIQKGYFSIQNIAPYQFTPDEFSSLVKNEVEKNKSQIIMLDSVSGYNVAVNHEDLVENLHILGKYLEKKNVAFFITTNTSNIIESLQISDIGISYFADNTIFLRYVEIRGEIQKVIGVLKKRMSNFEKTLRKFEITPDGLKIGEPLHNLRGILTGIPDFLD